jgi:hypothetical protein
MSLAWDGGGWDGFGGGLAACASGELLTSGWRAATWRLLKNSSVFHLPSVFAPVGNHGCNLCWTFMVPVCMEPEHKHRRMNGGGQVLLQWSVARFERWSRRAGYQVVKQHRPSCSCSARRISTESNSCECWNWRKSILHCGSGTRKYRGGGQVWTSL